MIYVCLCIDVPQFMIRLFFKKNYHKLKILEVEMHLLHLTWQTLQFFIVCLKRSQETYVDVQLRKIK